MDGGWQGGWEGVRREGGKEERSEGGGKEGEKEEDVHVHVGTVCTICFPKNYNKHDNKTIRKQ